MPARPPICHPREIANPDPGSRRSRAYELGLRRDRSEIPANLHIQTDRDPVKLFRPLRTDETFFRSDDTTFPSRRKSAETVVA
jgi:hypothetical protein